MNGMDELTGLFIDGDVWLRQAIKRGVMTPKGTKIMNRRCGTNYLKNIARSITQASVLDLTAEISDSLEESIDGLKVKTIA